MVTPELMAKIDERRGDMSREQYVEQCVESFVSRRRPAPEQGCERYATIEQFEEFQRKVERLERRFIEFLVNYGLELGR